MLSNLERDIAIIEIGPLNKYNKRLIHFYLACLFLSVTFYSVSCLDSGYYSKPYNILCSVSMINISWLPISICNFLAN